MNTKPTFIKRATLLLMLSTLSPMPRRNRVKGGQRLAKGACLITFSFLSFSAFAQGTAFTYQGRLNDGDSPANGSYDLTFALFNVVSGSGGGAQLGATLTNTPTGVTNGLFTVALDFGANFPGADRWLEIAVRTNGVASFFTLTPRQALTPAPYAITAGNVISGGLAAGTYANAVTFNNAANSFSGSGAGLTALNASQLTSGTVPAAALNNAWKTIGNSGTVPGLNFLGTTDNQPLELWVNGVRGLLLEPNTNGAPNVIGGSPANFAANGVFGATIGGGGATNYFGSSFTNSVRASFGTVGGGSRNAASGWNSTVGGGYFNTATEAYATVGGGGFNINSGFASTIGGGELNTNSGSYSTISGGYNNTVTADNATVGGATVGGGGYNTAAADYSFAAGFRAKALHSGSFVWADVSQAADFASTGNNQFSIRAGGGIRLAGDVQIGTDGGEYHHLRLSGGNSWGYLYGAFNPLGDGIHLGYNWYYDAGGGPHIGNSGGGTSRISTGYGEIVLAVGGVNSAPTAVRLDATTAGVTVYGTFNNSSDRNAKQDFAPVSPLQILDKVLRLPVSEWSYQADAATRHIGPMGQDFYSVFNIGTDDKHIAPIDEGGVALAAIQGLNRKLDAENTQLRQRLAVLETIVLNQKSN